MEKPVPKPSELRWDYHEIIDYIEDKYKIETRGYIPKVPLTQEQLDRHFKQHGRSSRFDNEAYLDFWHYLIDHNEVHNGCYIYLNLLGDYYKGKAEDDGDWDGDDEYRPRWVREIQKMIYDEFKPEGGEMKCWVEW